jgi:WD40 repeat protein
VWPCRALSAREISVLLENVGEGREPITRTIPPMSSQAFSGTEWDGVDHSHIINTGEGIVWTIDWCSPAAGWWLLAVGCHPPGSNGSLHEVNRPCPGKDAVIQIWSIEDSGADAKIAPFVNLVHDGGVAWSLCWCPSPDAVCEGRLGLLAAVLGDGSICVWDVPALKATNVTCKVEPLAKLPPNHADGSIPCTLDWLPHEPYDLLLVGYRDGCVSIVQLLDEDGPGMSIMQYFPAEALTLTAAKWFPAETRNKCIDNGAERRTFVTCGHESALNIWDARMEYSPQVSIKTGSSYTVQDMCWTTNPLGAILSMEDGSLRAFLMGATEIESQLKSGRPLSLITYKGNLQGGLWAVDAGAASKFAKDHQTIAYAGEDGIVGIMGNPSYQYLAKKRKEADIPIARLDIMETSNTRRFRLQSGNQVDEGTLYTQNSANVKGRSLNLKKDSDNQFTNAAQTIYSLRWTNSASSGNQKGQWLAYGNASGLVHCIWMEVLNDARS